MSVTSVDVFAAFAPPAKPAEPSSRGAELDRSFAPELARAYQDQPKQADLTSKRPADDDRPPAAKSPDRPRDEHGKQSSDAKPPVDEATASQEKRDDRDEKHAKDSADISQDGAAAAAGQPPKPSTDAKASGQAHELEPKVAGKMTPKTEAGASSGEEGSASSRSEDGGNGPKGKLAAGKPALDKSSEGEEQHSDAASKGAAATKKAAAGKGTTPKGEGTASSQQGETTGIEGGQVAKGSSSELTAGVESAGSPDAAGVPSTSGSKTSGKKADKSDDASAPLVGNNSIDAIKSAPTPQSTPGAVAVNIATPPAVIPAMESAKNTVASAEKPEAVGPAGSATRGSATLERLAARAVRAGESDSQSNAPGVDRARFVQRIEGAMRAAQQRDGRIQVRLSPPELGNLKIELTIHNGVMSARLEADTPAAKNTLLDNLPALRDRLAQQDIRVEKFEVDIRRDSGGGAGSGGSFDRPTGQPNSEQHHERPRAPLAATARAAAARPAAAASVGSDAALDVRI
jgi:flagellar hook-length control protein FliK